VLNSGFLKVFRQIGRYRPKQATLYTWIRTIIIHTCLDFLRGREKWARQELEAEEELPVAASVLEQLDAGSLLALVRRLPPATGAVFNLFVLDGYSHREIAGMLGITEGTSKWHLNAARKALQTFLKNEDLRIHG
ncbi:MAG TPA: RNA polymerase sigma factor, partial [Chitinophagaceae bacterium]|nr:RNA polymerase sigma factor [Chitinophagaceae bacterium]